MARDIDPAARERVLAAAEKQFSERGFAAVTLRDIAHDVGLNHASLYHHVPGGKEALYVEVMRRGLHKHHAGLQHAIAHAGDDWREQLRAAAHWLISQPALDITRMRLSDMPALQRAHAHQLSKEVYELLLQPIEQVFRKAEPQADRARAILLTGMFLFMAEGVHSAPVIGNRMSPAQMADQMVDVMVNGLGK